jgi:predicted nucleic acid-binding protein
MEIAIDTSVLVGLLDTQDVWHTPAVRLQEAISSGSLEPVYFDCVLAEAISTLSRRLREKHRETEIPSLVNRLLADFSSEVITWLLPDVPRLYRPVMELIRSSAGELNFNSRGRQMFRQPFIIRLQRYDRQSTPHPPGRLGWMLIGPGLVLACLALAILLWPELLAYMVAMLLLLVGLVLIMWGLWLWQAERHWR